MPQPTAPPLTPLDLITCVNVKFLPTVVKYDRPDNDLLAFLCNWLFMVILKSAFDLRHSENELLKEGSVKLRGFFHICYLHSRDAIF